MSDPLDWARVPAENLTKSRVRRNLAIWERTNRAQGRVITTRDDGDHLLYEAWQGRTLSTEFPSIEVQANRVFRSSRPAWSPSTVREALGVPAIFRAASLIATVVGSLSMQAYRKQVVMAPEDRPQLIVRPDPARTPRHFYRDTGWNLARYGEGWWYVSSRDRDGLAEALYNVPDPREVQVEDNPDDPIRPHITWRNRSTRDGTLRRDDLRQLTFLTDDGTGRGIGPLQLCGAAASVAVEAQQWAQSFYAAGGYPSILIKSSTPLGGGPDGWSTEDETDAGIESEAERLKAQWMESPPNTPKVVDPTIADVEQLEVPTASAQALEARNMQNGEAARMFGIPGVLLEYVQSGSSLTYQNIETVFTQWLKIGLRPGYLEEIEQAMSDLLSRTTAARFNTEQLEMPDLKTRYEVYGLGIDKGIITPEYAQAREGILPGDVENATVPQPAMRPAIPVRSLSEPGPGHAVRDWRCSGCGNKLLELAGPGSVATCRRCKARNEVAAGSAMPPQPAPHIELHFPSDFVRVESPVTVSPAPVTVQPAEVVVHPPAVTVNPSPIHFHDREVADEGPVELALRDVAETQRVLNDNVLALRRQRKTTKVDRDKSGLIIGTHEEITEATEETA